MKREVLLRVAAVSDLAAARAWYDNRRDGLGNEFLAAIAIALKNLEEDPERFPIYYRDFRRLLVDRFPYKLFYRIHGNRIMVFRIIHVANDHRDRLRGI